jgi:hypothetical protein
MSLLTGVPTRTKGKEHRKDLTHERGLIRSNLLFESGELPDRCALRNFYFLWRLRRQRRTRIRVEREVLRTCDGRSVNGNVGARRWMRTLMTSVGERGLQPWQVALTGPKRKPRRKIPAKRMEGESESERTAMRSPSRESESVKERALDGVSRVNSEQRSRYCNVLDNGYCRDNTSHSQ